jgi:hypothetical protein
VLLGVGVLVAAAVTESLALLALGLLLLLAGVLCAIALSALYTATAPAIVIDGVGALAGMRRSWQLRRPRFWPTVGAVLLAGLLSAVVGQAITTIPTVLALGFGGPFAWVIVAASGIVAQLVQVPFLTIFSTLLYFDGRIRREGFDLELLAHELGG